LVRRRTAIRSARAEFGTTVTATLKKG
jgi:hypothetical protein